MRRRNKSTMNQNRPTRAARRSAASLRRRRRRTFPPRSARRELTTKFSRTTGPSVRSSSARWPVFEGTNIARRAASAERLDDEVEQPAAPTGRSKRTNGPTARRKTSRRESNKTSRSGWPAHRLQALPAMLRELGMCISIAKENSQQHRRGDLTADTIYDRACEVLVRRCHVPLEGSTRWSEPLRTT